MRWREGGEEGEEQRGRQGESGKRERMRGDREDERKGNILTIHPIATWIPHTYF